MPAAEVDILLATWNGATCIGQLLDSLEAQTHAQWNLLARDDGSSGPAAAILESFQQRLGRRVRVVRDGDGPVGACQGFGRLLAVSKAPYAMFCDCDDVWLSDKVERTVRKMRELEMLYGGHRPLLVHTDLQVVDESLRPVAGSFWQDQAVRPGRLTRLSRLLVQNAVSGCTTMINRPLRDLACPIPPEALAHDWWVALVASALGHVGFVARATMLCRHRRAEGAGARRWGVGFVLRAASDLKALRQGLARRQSQARAFVERYGSGLDGVSRPAAQACASLSRMGFLQRRLSLVRHRLLMTGLAGNLGLFLAV